MSKSLASVKLAFGILTLSMSAAYAQGSGEIVVVRQGDTIEWIAAGPPPHKVRFGGGGAVTSVADAEALLDFEPDLTPGPGDVGDSPQLPSGSLLKATVLDTAAPGKTFVFNCGVHFNGPMISVPFTIAAKVAGEPARTHRIIGGPGLNWHLHVDTTP
jgi:hypothetical protein